MSENKIKIIAETIVRIKLGTATDKDWIVLEGWLNEREGNPELYRKIIEGEEIRRRLKLKNKIEEHTDYDQLKYHILHKIAARRRVRRIITVGSIVAACFTGLIANMLLLQEADIAPEKIASGVVSEVPEQDKVMLIMESGKQIGLIKDTPDSIVDGQAVILKKDGLLSYQSRKDSSVREDMKHQIITSTGVDFSFLLSDGTRVWLNASTKLEYPSVFAGQERVVSLTGEAYFEVKPDKKPFIVRTGDIRTKALGTAFNINAYPDEENILTTLISGKIEVAFTGNPPGKSRVILTPEMQSEWVKGSDRFLVGHAKTDDVIAWKAGIFVFNEDALGVVLRVLTRWYGVHFRYDPEALKHHTFSGRISKDESLSYILETFTLAAGPKFEFIDNQVIKVKNQ